MVLLWCLNAKIITFRSDLQCTDHLPFILLLNHVTVNVDQLTTIMDPLLKPASHQFQVQMSFWSLILH